MSEEATTKARHYFGMQRSKQCKWSLRSAVPNLVHTQLNLNFSNSFIKHLVSCILLSAEWEFVVDCTCYLSFFSTQAARLITHLDVQVKIGKKIIFRSVEITIVTKAVPTFGFHKLPETN